MLHGPVDLTQNARCSKQLECTWATSGSVAARAAALAGLAARNRRQSSSAFRSRETGWPRVAQSAAPQRAALAHRAMAAAAAAAATHVPSTLVVLLVCQRAPSHDPAFAAASEVLRAAAARLGVTLSLNGEPALPANKLTHICCSSTQQLQVSSPSLWRRHVQDPEEKARYIETRLVTPEWLWRTLDEERHPPVAGYAMLATDSQWLTSRTLEQWHSSRQQQQGRQRRRQQQPLGRSTLDGGGGRLSEAEYAVPDATAPTPTPAALPPTVDLSRDVSPAPPPAKKMRRAATRAPSEEWPCSTCTLRNVGNQCAACGTDRPRGSHAGGVFSAPGPVERVIVLSDDDEPPPAGEAAARSEETTAGDSDAQLAAQLAGAELDAASLALARQLQAEEDVRGVGGRGGGGHRQQQRPRAAHKPPPPPGPRRVFSGASFYLNKLRHRGSRDVRQPVGAARPPEIDPHEIIWDARCAYRTGRLARLPRLV